MVEQPVGGRDWLWIVAALWLTGMTALLCDHLQAPKALVVGVRALFGVATSCGIGLLLVRKAHALAGTSQGELYSFSRFVSRCVYILLYSLAITRVVFFLYESTSDRALPVRPLEDFQIYVALCVVPLWVIRAVVLALPFKRPAVTSRAHLPRANESPDVTPTPQIR